MKKTRNLQKFWAMLLALMMVVSILPMSAMAANVTLETPDEGLSLTRITTEVPADVDYYYEVTSTTPGYHPFNFSLLVNAPASYTVTGFEGAVATQEGTTAENYWLIIPDSTQESYVDIVCNGEVSRIKLDIPSGGDTPTGTGVAAYIPAPGQFTNEGVGTGGWGDIHTSSGGVKSMVGQVASTGVSLGFFGGSVVFYFEDGITDDPANPYGVDFIVYGNAFKNNSEPGCIQVSEDGTTWYDIAGSLHYDDGTVWNARLTYANPTPADDKAGSSDSTLADVSYTGTVSGTIAKNNFHKHAWYPLNRNYGPDLAQLANWTQLGSYDRNSATGEGSLALTGTLLGSATDTKTASYTFGYADVHPNGSAIGTASNPYAASESTTGGDGIDLAWAVNSDGTPAKVGTVHYVRVYTGTARMNGMFGEISTEVCGIAVTTGETTETAVAPAITINGVDPTGYGIPVTVERISDNQQVVTIPDISTYTGATSFSLEISGGTNIFMNGSKIDNLNIDLSSGGATVQVINQTGSSEGFISLIKLSA